MLDFYFSIFASQFALDLRVSRIDLGLTLELDRTHGVSPILDPKLNQIDSHSQKLETNAVRVNS